MATNGSAPQAGGHMRGYEIRTGLQRPPYELHARVSDSFPIGRGPLAPVATPSAAPYASSRSQSGTVSGVYVRNTSFSMSSARTLSHLAAASSPSGVSRNGNRARIQPTIASSATTTVTATPQAEATRAGAAGTTETTVRVVSIQPSEASRASPRRFASAMTSASKS
jgi:hypothetical protein